MSRIEIIHWNDPDDGNQHTVFLDGVEVTAQVYSIDPGRKYSRTEWDQMTEWEVASASPAVAAVLRDARNDAADNSPYVEGDR